MKLRTRFAVAGTVASTIVALGVGGFLFKETRSDLRSSFDSQLVAQVEAIGPGIASAPSDDRLVDVLSANAQQVGIRVLRPGDTETRIGNVPVRPPTLQNGAVQTVREGGHSWRALQAQLQPTVASGVTGVVTVQTFAPTDAVDSRITQLRKRVVRISLASIALGFGLSWFVGGYAARPMKRLTNAAEELGDRAGEERRVPDSQGVDEVDELGSTLNLLLGRLNEEQTQTLEALDAARGFSWNAVHELRTPLMSMRTDLDVLAGHSDLTQAKRDEIVAGLTAQHQRITDLLRALHDLARTDLQTKELFARVDLAEIAEAAADAARAHNPEVTIELVTPDHVWAEGWAEGIRLALDNMLTNAIHHGHQPNAPAEIVLRVEEPSSLIVDDSGPGVPENERHELFERFKRGGSTAPGLGLGLALVRQQALLHDGEAIIGDSPSGGARISLKLSN